MIQMLPYPDSDKAWLQVKGNVFTNYVGTDRVVVSGSTAVGVDIFNWANGGVIYLNDNNGAAKIRMYTGANGGGAVMAVDGITTTQVMQITGGSDLAEPFETSCGSELDPGTVVIIDDQNPGKLCVASEPYDSRVAGVISGAGGIKPGLTLKQEGLLESGQNVALSGRVFVRASTVNGAIKPGDLLTTSSAPGLAMKATDRDRAFGSTIGKAMGVLEHGEGLVLALVNLH